MGSPSESGAELFAVPYFGKKAYLAQSPQFYKQYGMAAGFDRVFEIGPVFRANPSFTSRHDTEFTSVDVEMAWVNSHYDVMAMEERWLHHVLKRVADAHGQELEDRLGVKVVVPQLPFPKIPMSEAVRILNEELGYTVPPETKGDLDPKGERLLGEYAQKHWGHEFVFVTDYPISVRPFYHMRHDDDPNLTKSFDLLWKGLEVTTGAQREHRYDVLAKQAQEKGLSLEPIDYYMDIFKYGAPPHGGYGFGLTRMLMSMMNLDNVREATYLYRNPRRLKP
jgi:aspartyl-tRNA synthetase